MRKSIKAWSLWCKWVVCGIHSLTDIQIYLRAFSRLLRAPTKYGKAPHKIVMLLSVLQAVQNNDIKENCIGISPELVLLFRANWSKLVHTNHVNNFALPFWHLKSEGFWNPVPKYGFENILHLKESVSSLGVLNSVINYVKLDDPLFRIMKDAEGNKILQQFLMQQYFPEVTETYQAPMVEQKKLFNNLESKILNETPREYVAEIKELLLQKNEEEIFLRGSLFKREVPKIYNYSCCISGMKIDSMYAISMVDACHIVPFSESYDDTITNGIALCPNLHRAFDRGLIAIDEKYRVMVSPTFMEDNNTYSIRTFENKEISLPDKEDFYPSKINFEWHREKIFKRNR